MKAIHVSEDIVPIGEFKAKAAQLLRSIAKTGQSLVITQNGRPAGVVISPREFDRLQDRQRFLESIAAGLADAEAGRMMTTTELRQRMGKSFRWCKECREMRVGVSFKCLGTLCTNALSRPIGLLRKRFERVRAVWATAKMLTTT